LCEKNGPGSGTIGVRMSHKVLESKSKDRRIQRVGRLACAIFSTSSRMSMYLSCLMYNVRPARYVWESCKALAWSHDIQNLKDERSKISMYANLHFIYSSFHEKSFLSRLRDRSFSQGFARKIDSLALIMSCYISESPRPILAAMLLS
jgi:hypothetical protein